MTAPSSRGSVLALPVLLALLTSAGCGSSGPAIDPTSLAPGEQGPFRTGYRVIDVEYQDPMGEARTIPVHLWYPTEESGEGLGRPVYAGLFRDDESFVEAAPARPVHPNKRFPLLVYSHGHQGVEGGHHRLMRHFTSHGWVGVAVGHVGDRLLDGGESGIPLSQFVHRASDITAALDALEALQNAPLAGELDTSRVLLTGHSRGAYSTFAAAGVPFDLAFIEAGCDDESTYFHGTCTPEALEALAAGRGDERVAAILPTASNGHAEMFGGFAEMKVEVPVLYMTAENDVDGEPLYEGVPAETALVWVELSGGCHEIFNLGLGCKPDVEAYGDAAFFTYAMAFARARVLGEENEALEDLLAGRAEVVPEATLRARGSE